MFEPRPNRRVVSIAVSVLCLTLAAAVRPSTATSAATPFLVGTSSTYAYVDSAASGQAEAFLTTATTTGTVSALRVYVDATAAAGPLTAATAPAARAADGQESPDRHQFRQRLGPAATSLWFFKGMRCSFGRLR